MSKTYDKKYAQSEYYWGKTPSKTVYKVLKLKPPVEHLKVLVIGCGEGRNAVFLARNGYHVSAFDLSSKGVEKTKKYAEKVGVKVNAF